MRHDDQVKSALAIKKHVIVSTGHEIDSENEKAKEFFEDEISNLHSLTPGTEPGFDEAIKDLLSCYDYGFSMTEPVFEIKSGGPHDGLWGLKFLKTRPPHTFEFNMDDKGNVEKVVQNVRSGRLKFDPGHFLHLPYQSDFGNPYGTADLKAAHSPWKTKKFIDRFFPIYLERFTAPFPVARYEAGLEKAEIDELAKILDNFQITSNLVIPKDVDIELIETSKDASEAYERAIDHYNMRIARAILVPDLLGMGGSKTGGGSFSLGEKQFELFMMVANSMRNTLERLINARIVRPLAMVNFGEEVANQTKFKWLPFTEDMLVDHFKTWADAIKQLGVNPTPEQVNHLHKALGFPEAEEVEFKPDPIDPLSPEGQEATQAQEEAAAKRKEKEAGKKPDKGAGAARGGGKQEMAARPQTDFEAKMNFAGIRNALDESENRLEALARPLTQKMRDALLRDALKPYESKNVAAISRLDLKFKKQLKNAWAGHFEALYVDSVAEAKREILPRGKFQDEPPLLPDEFVKVIEAESFSIVGAYSLRVTNRAKALLTQGIKDGMASRELFGILREEIADESDRWLQTVVRTKTTEIYNEARKQFYETDEIASQIVEAYQWSAVLDTRTSRVCRSLDKKIFKIGDFTNQVKPPAHFNCRSILVPITKFEKYSPSPKPAISTLRQLGGNLILPSKKKFDRANANVISANLE